MRIVFALAGLHRVNRGAEIAFESIASELALAGEEVTLIGHGPPLPGRPYRYIPGSAVPRRRFERFPRVPLFRDENVWEEASFVPSLLRNYHPDSYDVTVTCSYPFTNWVLRRPLLKGRRPPHVFVTQNGDWPAQSHRSEFRLFGCDGLVCINPDYFERNAARYRCALIPNGVDLKRFRPGISAHELLGLDPSRAVVLMVSALILSKNVEQGIRAVAGLPDAVLVVAGDGPLRDKLQKLADELLPDRYRRLSLPAVDMPLLYRTADAFMHLSRDESFGNVFVESMACGVPIVAPDQMRTRWIVGDEAFYAQSDSIESLTKQLAEALKLGRSRSQQAIKRASAFGWPRIADQYRDFLGEVINASR